VGVGVGDGMGVVAATGVPLGGAHADVKTISAVTTTAWDHLPLTSPHTFANRKSKGRESEFS
jgi:hypothetical protein